MCKSGHNLICRISIISDVIHCIKLKLSFRLWLKSAFLPLIEIKSFSFNAAQILNWNKQDKNI